MCCILYNLSNRAAEEWGSRKTNVNLALTGEDQLIVLPLLLVLLNIEVSYSLICTWTSSASVWLQSLQTHITKTGVLQGEGLWQVTRK